jgi:hypothetical protein
MAERITINGVDIEVISCEQAERATLYVCGWAALATPFADNVLTNCAFCQTPVVHRPHAPKTPLKVCLTCAIDAAKPGEPS